MATTHYDIGAAEHGANASITYARCACGWSGKPRRSLASNSADLSRHLATERYAAKREEG